jgi:hypothetical protein
MKVEEAKAYKKPIDRNQFPKFYATYVNPLDLAIIDKRIHEGYYDRQVHEYIRDCRSVFNNSRDYFSRGSRMWETAQILKDSFDKKVKYQFGWALRLLPSNATETRGRKQNVLVKRQEEVHTGGGYHQKFSVGGGQNWWEDMFHSNFQERRPKNVKITYANEIKEQEVGAEDHKYFIDPRTGQVFTSKRSAGSTESKPAKEAEVEEEDEEEIPLTNLKLSTLKEIFERSIKSRVRKQVRPKKFLSSEALNALAKDVDKNTNAPLTLTEKGADELLERLKGDFGTKIDTIRDKSYQLATSKWKDSPVPFAAANMVVEDYGQ